MKREKIGGFLFVVSLFLLFGEPQTDNMFLLFGYYAFALFGLAISSFLLKRDEETEEPYSDF